MDNLYDSLNEATRKRFLTVIGVNIEKTSAKEQRVILDEYNKEDVDILLGKRLV